MWDMDQCTHTYQQLTGCWHQKADSSIYKKHISVINIDNLQITQNLLQMQGYSTLKT